MPQHLVTINTYGPTQPFTKSVSSTRALARLAKKLSDTPNIDTVIAKIDSSSTDAASAIEVAREAGWSIG